MNGKTLLADAREQAMARIEKELVPLAKPDKSYSPPEYRGMRELVGQARQLCAEMTRLLDIIEKRQNLHMDGGGQ